MIVRFYDKADKELDEAVTYYEDRSEGLGDKFILAVKEGIEYIVENPSAWRKLSKNMRLFKLKQFPYGIIYHVSIKAIYIFAIVHLKKKPGSWKK